MSTYGPQTPNPSFQVYGTAASPVGPPTGGARTVVADASYSITANDRYIALTTQPTVDRALLLPFASAFPVGTWLYIADESGNSGAFQFLLSPQSGDTIDGTSSIRIGGKYGAIALQSNGATKWSAPNPFSNPDALLQTSISSASYTAKLNDRLLACSTNVTAISITLPDSSKFPQGTFLNIADIASNGLANNVTVLRAGTDTINGGLTSFVAINTNSGYAIAVSDAVGHWTVMRLTNSSAATIASTKLPLKGDNAGNAVAQVIQSVGDVSTTINAGTNVVLLTTALTAARTLTMPAASGYTAGDTIYILDPKGVVTNANTVSVVRAGSDTVNAGTAAVVVLSGPRGVAPVSLDNSGTNWGTLGSLLLRSGGFNDLPLSFGAANFGFTNYNTNYILPMTGTGATGPSLSGLQTSAGGVGIGVNQQYSFSSSGDPTSQDTALFRNAAGVVEINNGTTGTFRDVRLSHVLSGGTIPGIAAGTGAGGSPTVSMVANSKDLAGQISVLTGSAPAINATVVTVTPNRTFPTGCWVTLTPANAATAALAVAAQVFVPAGGTSTWIVTSNGTALTATTQYLWNYIVMGI